MPTLFLMLIAVTAYGCSEKPATATLLEKARPVITAKFSDPYSAVFENLTVRELGPNRRVLCGTVNAKNMLGGYAGRKVFFYVDGSTGLSGVEDDGSLGSLASSYCKKATE